MFIYLLALLIGVVAGLRAMTAPAAAAWAIYLGRLDLPTKTLVASAYAAHLARRAARKYPEPVRAKGEHQ